MWNEIRYAIRLHWRSKGFTFVAFLTLSLGIGLNTAVFGLVHALVLNPLPYGDINRLFEINATTPRNESRPVSLPDFLDWETSSRSFKEMAVYQDTQATLTGAGESAEVIGATVSLNFFSLLEVRPAIGRDFDREDAANNRAIVVLSERLWTERFDSSSTILDQSIVLNGVAHSIAGVMPDNVQYPRRGGIDLWILSRQENEAPSRAERRFAVVGRLNDGVSAEEARAEISGIAVNIGEAFPDTNKGWGIRLRAVQDRLVPEDLRLVLTIFSTGVTFVLLIACLNLASLLLARGVSRSREVAIRMSLGSSRFRLTRQFLIESLVLAVAGGAGGVLVASWGMNLLKQIAPTGAARVHETSLNPAVMVYVVAMSFVTTLAFGLIPAIKNSRLDFAEALKKGSHSTFDSSRKRLLSALIAMEIAVATISLAGGLLATRSLRELLAVDPGFDVNGIVMARLPLPAYSYAGPEQRIAVLDDVVARTRAIPLVGSVSAADSTPFGGSSSAVRIGIPGVIDIERNLAVGRRIIASDYFATLGVSLLRGRDFTRSDGIGTLPVAIINQAMQDRFWPGVDSIGRSLITGAAGTVVTIVGVSPNLNDRGPEEAVEPQIYLPYNQHAPPQMVILARTGADVSHTMRLMRESIRSIDRDLAVPELRSLRSSIDEGQFEGPRSGMAVLGTVSVFALALAGVGIYGVVRYSVSQRTREVGIRIALGAGPADVARVILRQCSLPILAGSGLGLIGAGVLNRAMSSLLFGVTPADPVVLALTLLILLSLAGIAVAGPVFRAIRTDPIVTLRSE